MKRFAMLPDRSDHHPVLHANCTSCEMASKTGMTKLAAFGLSHKKILAQLYVDLLKKFERAGDALTCDTATQAMDSDRRILRN